MSGIEKKIEKLGSLIKIRQIQLDQQLFELEKIRRRKEAAKAELLRTQTMYVKGIDRLNQERQSPERLMLEALENSIDLAKSLWHKRLMDLRDVELEERAQERCVAEAHKNKMMLEKLDGRYSADLNNHSKIVEQKQLDEFAVQAARRKI
ncbi:MAG: hypothetical protein EOP10_09815 [Proteobacteria bacterium]|nr:MAG: hypothetical protein EOP10_09815 [Pseudomonadota bacterium]